MSSKNRPSENNGHRKGSSFHEFVERKVDEARISLAGTSFASVQRSSSVFQQSSTDQNNSLHVSSSGTIVKHDQRRETSLELLPFETDEGEGDEDERSVTTQNSDLDQENSEEEIQEEDKSQDEEQNGKDETENRDEAEENADDEKEDDAKQSLDAGADLQIEEGAEEDQEAITGEEGENEEKGDETEDRNEENKIEKEEGVEEGGKIEDGEERKGGGEEEKQDHDVVEGEGESVIKQSGEDTQEGERKDEKEEEKGGGEEVEGKRLKDELKGEEEGEKLKDEKKGEEEEGKEKEQENAKEQQKVNFERDKKAAEEEKVQEEGGDDDVKRKLKIKEHEENILVESKLRISVNDTVVDEFGSVSERKTESLSFSTEHEMLSDKLKQINFELSYVNRKNRYLTKEAIEFRGKKADYDTGDPKLTQGYLKKLVNFEKIKFSITNEMKNITDQVDSFRERLKSAVEIYEVVQEEFMQKMSEACKKLDSNFGNVASEKTIVQPSHRIQTALANVGKMRLKMVKLQNRLSEKEAELKSLNDRGGGLHLIDYEKLKMLNLHLVETIAERDLELLRLRRKIQTDTQKLAHVRERADFAGEEIRNYNATLQDLDTKIKFVREEVNNMKQKRQRIAVETRKMRQDAGLLTKPNLVTSFRETELSLEAAKNQLVEVKLLYQHQKTKIDYLRERVHPLTEQPKH